jgi:copper chaperone CopZ
MTTRPALTRATFAIEGMQSPDDALRLEQCLASCGDGIRRVEVRWETQAAKIEFDEQTVSAQAIARLIAENDACIRAKPLVVRLLLKVPSIRNESSARLPLRVLHKLHEVESVTPQVGLQAVEVCLKLDGDLTTHDLIRALAAEEIVANVM